jgi:deoxyadenosine/deoxycytidine kinase
MLSKSHEFSCVIGIGGIRGVGKTTTLNRLRQSRNDIDIIHVSQELKRSSLEMMGINFFDCDVPTKNIIRIEVSSQLVERLMNRCGVSILDLHYTDYREDYHQILMQNGLMQIIDVFVFLDVSDETIINRRSKNLHDYEKHSITEIQQERSSEMQAVRRLILDRRCPGLFLSAEGTIDEIAAQLSRTINFSGMLI